ncbi:MAG TPA: phosphate-starvation-inducible PsiE family protein, partial [Actinomycetota bacterium]|nr:phosphate-starvation-inducible PsiE family protein [Actinomycetota bacterium]
SQLLGFLDAMLLVFIVTELIHTVRAILRENILMTEPFLIVGIVAAIRRLVVISAEIQDLVGKPEFSDALMEMGVLVAIVVGLAASIFMLRHTEHSEPRPSYEPE